ncbi:MAG TPA: hypothetical protein VG937_25270 [Polyangiaceae bacterium]|nr:hypothetical protein [Polyangiaceae bacterium]
MRPPIAAVVFALTGILVASCGATSSSSPDSDGKGGAGNGGESGARSSGGNSATGGRADDAGAGSGTGGTRGGSVATGGVAVEGGAQSGGTRAGGTTSGGGAGGEVVQGGAGTGGTHSGGKTASGGSSGGKASGGSGGQGASGSGGGSSGQSAGGSAGERAVQCTGATPYFPEFNRACAKPEDCLAVAHQTNCCGAQFVSAISANDKPAFDAAEATCEQQYPACGCAAFGVDVEDGTRVDFAWQDKVEVACEARTCKALYSGTSFACGTRRCTEQQYCVQSSGGPAGTPTSYSCNPTACTDCSCLTMPDCTCSNTDGHLTFICQHA